MMTEEMSIRDRLQADLKTAMRDRDDNARDTIRYILSAIKNAEIDHRGDLSSADRSPSCKNKQSSDKRPSSSSDLVSVPISPSVRRRSWRF